MLKIIVWTVGVFAVLKLGQLLSRTAQGYRDREGLPARRRLIDLVLLAFSLAVALIVTSYFNWWHHRLALREYGHASVCYAQLDFSWRSRMMAKRFDVMKVEDFAAAYRGVAVRHGVWAGMTADAIRQDLGRLKAERAQLYARMEAQRDSAGISALIGDVDRCLKDEWEPHGDLFNP